MDRVILGTVLLFASAGLIVDSLIAGEGCCARCGCVASCQKTCRLVTEEKKVEVVCWGCKCEDFCVGCHSVPGCEHRDDVCGACDFPKGTGEVCTKPHIFAWTEWKPPSRATVHTKKKLIKKVITKKVPSHKWVVEDLCSSCRDAGQ